MVKRYVCYPRSNKADMVALTPELLASTGYYDDFRKYVREEDYAALEARCIAKDILCESVMATNGKLKAKLKELRGALSRLHINDATQEPALKAGEVES